MKIQFQIKRFLDIIISILAIAILMPLLLIIGLIIYLEDKSSPIFLHDRIGKNGTIFKIWKFRTMVPNAEQKGTGIKTSHNDTRITKTGAFIRKTSIDELLQFVNILKGEMSLIGPRPAPVFHLERYTEIEKIRLKVRPGVTGWAQVNGRNLIPWPERIKLDIWYIENYSLVLDFKIIGLTIKNIILKEGVYSK